MQTTNFVQRMKEGETFGKAEQRICSELTKCSNAVYPRVPPNTRRRELPSPSTDWLSEWVSDWLLSASAPRSEGNSRVCPAASARHGFVGGASVPVDLPVGVRVQRMPNCHKREGYENSAHAHKHSARVEPAERRALCLMQRLRQEEPEEGADVGEVRRSQWRATGWQPLVRACGLFKLSQAGCL